MMFRKSQAVSSKQLAEGLAELQARLSASDISSQSPRGEGGFELPGTPIVRALVLDAMFMLAFTQAAHSSPLEDGQAVLDDVGRRLRQQLIGHLLTVAEPGQDTRELANLLDDLYAKLVSVWNETLDRPPCPQHYVGREACAILSGSVEGGSLGCQTYLARMLFGRANAIKDLLDDVVGNYGVHK